MTFLIDATSDPLSGRTCFSHSLTFFRLDCSEAAEIKNKIDGKCTDQDEFKDQKLQLEMADIRKIFPRSMATDQCRAGKC